MATYVMLAQFTQQGITNIKNTAKRAEDFKLMASAHGVTVKEIFWTLGQYDVVVVVEAGRDFGGRVIHECGRSRQCAHANPSGIFRNGDKDHPRQDGLMLERSNQREAIKWHCIGSSV